MSEVLSSPFGCTLDCMSPFRKTMGVVMPENSKLLSYRNGSNLCLSPPFKEMNNGTGEMAQLKSELLDARKVAEELASRVRARKERIDELGGELEEKKREVSNLRLERGSILAEKARAEERAREAQARGDLVKEINEADEEHVLIELARIEAIKEAKEIEGQRKVEEGRHAQKLKDSKARIVEMKKQLADAGKLEEKFSATMADIVVLKREMVCLRAMEKKNNEKNDGKDEKDDVQRARAELEMAKKELDFIEAAGFKYTTSMDTIRKKIAQVPSRSWELREEEAEARIRSLNAELLQLNGELKATSSLESRRKDIVSNLSIALANLNKDKDKAVEETRRTEEETKHLQGEICRCNSKIDDTKEGLLAAMHGLERIKSSEAVALDELRQLCERTTSKLPRASGVIMVTQFEYEYLRKCGEGAREVATKKVEAAKAWVEALGSSEREVRLEIERVVRESEGLKGGIGREEEKVEKEREEEKVEREREEEKVEREREEKVRLPVSRGEGVKMVEVDPPRRSVKEKPRRRSGVHGHAPVRPPSITLHRRRKKKVVKNLARFLGGRKELD